MAANKYLDVIIAGFGGQGVLLIGNLLAYAGMKQNMCVTYIPVYGVEMRGGTANCSVVLSEEEIISPMVQNPTELIAMNKPSLIKFEPLMTPGGTLLVNSSIIEIKAARADISAYYIPCQEIADELGNRKTANMVMLGAYLEVTQCLHLKTVEQMLSHLFTGAKANLVALNKEALRQGAACILKAAS